MIEGDYKLIVKVLEANDLKPTDISFGFIHSKNENCNSFVQIEVLG